MNPPLCHLQFHQARTGHRFHHRSVSRQAHLHQRRDRINRIGEIGYFLASFEAAIAHIKEIDLTEDREDELSFLTVPLAEISAHSE